MINLKILRLLRTGAGIRMPPSIGILKGACEVTTLTCDNSHSCSAVAHVATGIITKSSHLPIYK